MNLVANSPAAPGSLVGGFVLAACGPTAPDGNRAKRSMWLAPANAGRDPAEVTHINAHCSSISLNDAAEAAAIRAAFGEGPPARPPAVTSIKGTTGHSPGAAEAVALTSTSPTIGATQVDPALRLDVVLEPRPWIPPVALSNSFAFVGHNTTFVLAAVL